MSDDELLVMVFDAMVKLQGAVEYQDSAALTDICASLDEQVARTALGALAMQAFGPKTS